MALDLLIRNGTVIDGSGQPRFQADVGIANGRLRDPAVRGVLVADESAMKPRDNVFQGGGAAPPRIRANPTTATSMRSRAWTGMTRAWRRFRTARASIRWRS